LLTREDNADEESIRPYLPPIVEAKANAQPKRLALQVLLEKKFL
jgi:hypothetical protein